VLSVGHSSTSISAGIGIAVAAAKEDKQRRTVCVIGDGAITAGMAFEAMNHAGDIKPDMLVMLNDNEMSISENVGALNNHLAQLLSGKLYSTLREGGKKVFSGVPPIKELLKRTEEHIKGMVVPGTLFEELGFNYIGPVDGHDVLGLVTTLKNMRDLKGPQFLHIMTKKGVATSRRKKTRLPSTRCQNLTIPAAVCRKAAAACRAIRKSSATGCAKPRRKTTS
jgi:1-deoxy-D-xylulose-5-phosphate synthase